jgi:hypothetical protein
MGDDSAQGRKIGVDGALFLVTPLSSLDGSNEMHDEAHNDTIEKGIKLNHIERSRELPSPRTGSLAARRGLLCRGGSGAPSARERVAVVVVGVVLCLVLLAPSVASAHFVRPFLRSFAGTPTGKEGAVVPFGFEVRRYAVEGKEGDQVTEVAPGGPFGVAVDGEGNVWAVGNRVEGEEQSAHTITQLDEFGPSGAYKEMLEPVRGGESVTVEGLAINTSANPLESYAGAFYLASSEEVDIFSKAGVFEKSFPYTSQSGREHTAIAVDNSTDPLDLSAGDVYIYEGLAGKSLLKFNAAGEPENWEDFKGSETCGCSVSKNEILFQNGGSPEGGVAVDPSDGDIWVGSDKSVFEFSPSGELIREITEGEAPGLSGVAPIYGLAVDPANRDVLVSLGEGAVDEFDSEGAFLGQITEAAGRRFSGAHGVAVDSEGHAYVINRSRYAYEGGAHELDEFEEGHFVPGLRLSAATQRTQTSAVLNGYVDPESELNPERVGGEKVGIVDCRFEYVTEAAYKTSGFEDLSSGGEAPCEDPDAAGIPKSDAYTPVHAAVSEHIESGVTYRFRLSATTGGLLGGSEHTFAVAFTAAHAPRVSATAASEVTSTFARLSGDVAPLGADTTYRFQYLTEEQFKANGESFVGAAVAPATPVDIGFGGEAGDLVEAVSEQVGGLEPGTAYRFRLVASNAVGVSEGEVVGGVEVADVFATEPGVSPVLPEGRAYELVTPPDKEGAEDLFEDAPSGDNTIDQGVSSESGDQFMLYARAAFGPFPASGRNFYVFSRHAVAGHPGREEWGYTPLASSALGLQNLEGVGAIEPEDFSSVALADTIGAPASEVGSASTSLVGPVGGPYTVLHRDQATHEQNAGRNYGYPQERTMVVGGSRDLGVVVLESTNPALAEGGVCERDFCAEPPIPNLFEWSGGVLSQVNVQSDGEPIPCGAVLGNGPPDTLGEEPAVGAVSADGSKVFFTVPDPDYGCPIKGGDNTSEVYMRSGEETIEVSAPEEGAPEHKANHEAVFMGAADDGSRVFFTSEGELTANDAGIHDTELYEYDTETGKLTRISAGDSGDATGDVVLRSEGGREPRDVIVSRDGSHVYFVARGVLAPANAEGRPPVEGEENLYVYDALSGRVAFIASGSGGEYVNHEVTLPETTPDGGFLLFQGEMLSRGALQLYRYDAETEGLVCVNCTAAYPSGVSGVSPSVVEDESLRTLPAHAIAEDGTVFFNTVASLVPQDTNGVLDVYEWHEGAISMLSSGQDPLNSYFLGASPNGANVFFGTHARLVPADTSGGGNVYDARVCEPERGNPCIASAPSQEGLCEGDACSHPAAAPSDATPGSATFSGPGDLTPAPSTTPKAKTCVKPKKLSHGKCIAVKPRHRKAKAKAKPRAKAERGSRMASARRATRSDKGGKR